MCGIAGILRSRRGEDPTPLAEAVRSMTESIVHRGPDANGTWTDGKSVALGSRRLAILDLSARGEQPMTAADGRFYMVYNGEVYNFLDLRDQLESAGITFRSRTDTEVVVEAMALWGAQKALPRLNGMFAFALWDARERVLHLARDPHGQKPLYYGLAGDGALVFGSELKALHRYGAYRPEVDPDALAAYFRRGYVPAPHSIYRRTWKLPAGHHLSISLADLERGEFPAATRYFDPAVPALPDGGREDPVEALDTLLRDAVARAMVSDVPIGALLSGGIDSTTVVAMMQRESGRPVRTFTIGFEVEKYDEAEHAAAIAAHLGTDHTELVASEADALAMVDELPRVYDEPLADSSQIPTCLVSRLTRGSVKVALSGDGGDELFGGYPRYRHLQRLRAFTRLPKAGRHAAGWALRALPCPGMERRQRARKLAEIVPRAASPEDLWRNIASIWKDPVELVAGRATEPPRPLTHLHRAPETEILRWAMATDTLEYLPDDILVKIDRASMAVGLELRAPLLDPRVAGLAAALPTDVLIGAHGKALLRQVLDRYVPRPLVDRPKRGFQAPLGGWLRGRLRDWAEDLLESRQLESSGLHPGPIRERWAAHLRNENDWSPWLWPVLMYGSWRRIWG